MIGHSELDRAIPTPRGKANARARRSTETRHVRATAPAKRKAADAAPKDKWRAVREGRDARARHG